jgi:hypothetical protein
VPPTHIDIHREGWKHRLARLRAAAA